MDAIIDPVKESIAKMNVEVETLLTLFALALLITLLVRVISGFTLAGFLGSFLLACLGAIGGWIAEQRLRLPALYALPFPGDRALVPIVWPGLGAIVAALLAARLWRPARPRRTRRRAR